MPNSRHLLDSQSLLLQFTPPRLGLCFPGDEPMLDWCVCFGLLFTSDVDLGRTFILPYGTFSSGDASYQLIPINGHLHMGLKPSINGRAARLWTECTQPGDCLSHRHFQQIYVRAAAERSLSGTPMHLRAALWPYGRHTE